MQSIHARNVGSLLLRRLLRCSTTRGALPPLPSRPLHHALHTSPSPNPHAPQPPTASTSSSLNPVDLIPLSSTVLHRPAAQQQQQQQPHDPPDTSGEDFQVPPLDLWGSNELLMTGCEAGSPLNVAVLLSGGVDSSLALRLLLAAGHKCTAFYLQIWFQEDFRNFWDACPWEEDLGYAQKVCDALGVELRVVPMTQQYWERVVAHSVHEIREGRTPNPDMLCNSCVKFGAFHDYLQEQHAGSFDRIASGHYARVVRGEAQRSTHAPASTSTSTSTSTSDGCEQPRPAPALGSSENPGSGRGGGSQVEAGAASCSARLALTPDPVKDQTYFLAHLSPAQLSRAMFPLGALTKRQVRQLAAAANLANMNRKDSQGICFLGKVKFHEFVKEHLGEWPGLLVESESSQVLGLHQGYWFYTVGQRSGIKLPGGPWYVVRKDRDLNVVYASKHYYEEGKSRNTFSTGPLNWVSGARPDPEQDMYCKVRHGPTLYRCASFQLLPSTPQSSCQEAASSPHAPPAAAPSPHGGPQAGGPEAGAGGARVVLESNDQGLAAGQYAVFYQGGTCLGAAKLL